jgi:hypothetical protein
LAGSSSSKGFFACFKNFHTSKRCFSVGETDGNFRRQREIPSVQQKLAADSSLSDLITRYIQTVTSTKRSAEYETIILQALLRHPISQKSLKELQVKDFANYRDERLKEISGASLRRQLNPIRHMFQIAINEWGIPLKAKDNRRERRLKDGEYEKLLAAARTRQNPSLRRLWFSPLRRA